MIYEATVDGRTVRVEVRGTDGRYTVVLDGQAREVDAREVSTAFLSLIVDGRSHEAGLERRTGGWRVALPGGPVEISLAEAAGRGVLVHRKAVSGPARVLAPMPGKIVRVTAAAGREVKAGDALLVMEAMKMENEIRAPRDGVVKEVAVQEQQAVETGALLILLE